jgi:hypothetical protein
MEIKEKYNTYFTEFKEVNSTQTIAILNNQFTWHIITSENSFKVLQLQLLKTLVFIFKD